MAIYVSGHRRHPSLAWQTPALDGEVYGQPLVYGSDVYVATENDSVYKLEAATGRLVWAKHLATPEPASVAPCGDIATAIGITSTPVIDPATNRIYAVGAVSVAGVARHELFALDLGSGQPVAGFPVAADPPYPAGGGAVNQLQRPGLALDGGRVLIGYGGNDGDCATYWGWLVSAPTNWHALDSSDADLGSSMPTLLPGGLLFESGKDGNGYLLDGARLGHVSPPALEVRGFCAGGSFGGSVYDSAESTIYVACAGGLQALALGSGSPPSLVAKAGFSGPATAAGPPMVAGGGCG